MRSGRTYLTFVAALMVVGAGLSACSSDGDESSGAGTADTTTITAAAGDADSFEPTGDQCAALETVPEDQADLDARVALFPDDLQDDVQDYNESIVAYLTSADPQSGEPTAPEPEPSETLAAVLATCASNAGTATSEAGAGEVTYQSMDLADGIATITVTAACDDGTFPEDVFLSFDGEQLGAFDRGDGEFAVSVEVDADATEEALIDELGLGPDDLSTTFSTSCI